MITFPLNEWNDPFLYLLKIILSIDALHRFYLQRFCSRLDPEWSSSRTTWSRLEAGGKGERFTVCLLEPKHGVNNVWDERNWPSASSAQDPPARKRRKNRDESANRKWSAGTVMEAGSTTREARWEEALLIMSLWSRAARIRTSGCRTRTPVGPADQNQASAKPTVKKPAGRGAAGSTGPGSTCCSEPQHDETRSCRSYSSEKSGDTSFSQPQH